MKDEMPQMKIRLDPGLKQKIKESARSSGRSMNSEIHLRLEQSFGIEPTNEPTNEPADLTSRMQDLEAKVANLERIIADRCPGD